MTSASQDAGPPPRKGDWIICVDDSPAFVGALAETLRLRDGVARVDAFTKSDASVKFLAGAETHPDLIVLDLNMPDPDGLAVLRRLDAMAVSSRVVMLTSEIELRDPVRRIGAQCKLDFAGVVVKGVLSETVDDVLRLLEKRPARPATKSGPNVDQGELLAALRLRRGFVNHYQAQWNPTTYHVMGAEALVRWRDPRGHVQPPMAFVDLLEEAGRSRTLTELVLITALTDLKGYLGGRLPRIAVNVSPSCLGDTEWPKILLEIVRKHGASPRQVTIEITESQSLPMGSEVLESLSRFRLLGFEIALDDFGTGFASLEQFQNLPVNEIKIDRSFVAGARDNVRCHEIVKNTINLARSTGVRSVGEGVETREDQNRLRELGCDCLQGFKFAKPAPASEFLQLLDASIDVRDWKRTPVHAEPVRVAKAAS